MRRVIIIVALGSLQLIGCVGVRPVSGTVVRSAPEPPPVYVIGCPDVIAVRIVDHPHLDCIAAVDLEGRLPLTDDLRPSVEGLTLDDARRSIAVAVGCDPGRVSIHVAGPRTSRVYLFGPELNRQQIVPYHGAERLVDFLHRTGRLADGRADLRDVCVLRPNVANGGEPQVYRADLRAVRDGDSTTNVVLEPGDQVFVGETRSSRFARMLPDWIQPGYRRMTGLNSPNSIATGD